MKSKGVKTSASGRVFLNLEKNFIVCISFVFDRRAARAPYMDGWSQSIATNGRLGAALDARSAGAFNGAHICKTEVLSRMIRHDGQRRRERRAWLGAQQSVFDHSRFAPSHRR
ncbi:hypothetical protein [Haliangium sp.]|uniref:hypothetical protein n=1 Tax=Haliangium sp. TaxID=2663208 RepID=UPI003D1197AB